MDCFQDIPVTHAGGNCTSICFFIFDDNLASLYAFERCFRSSNDNNFVVQYSFSAIKNNFPILNFENKVHGL